MDNTTDNISLLPGVPRLILAPGTKPAMTDSYEAAEYEYYAARTQSTDSNLPRNFHRRGVE